MDDLNTNQTPTSPVNPGVVSPTEPTSVTPPISDEPIPTFLPSSPPVVAPNLQPVSVAPLSETSASVEPPVLTPPEPAPLSQTQPISTPFQPAADNTNPFSVSENPTMSTQPAVGTVSEPEPVASPFGDSSSEPTTPPFGSSPAWGAPASSAEQSGVGVANTSASPQSIDDLFAKPNPVPTSEPAASPIKSEADSYNTHTAPEINVESNSLTGAGNMTTSADTAATVIAGQTSETNTNSTETNQVVSSKAKGLPKWAFIIGGIVVFIAIAGSAYFVLGLGQNKSGLLSAVLPSPTPTPTMPPPVEVPALPAEPSISPTVGPLDTIQSSPSGSINTPVLHATSSGTSAIDLLKQRSATPPAH